MNRARRRTWGAGLTLVAMTGCGGSPDVRGQQPAPSAAPSSSSSTRPPAPVPPCAAADGQADAAEVLAFAGLPLPPAARSVEAVRRPSALPSYRVTLMGDQAVVEGICDQMGGALLVSDDLTPGELDALGLSEQPPVGSPTCASSRRDFPRVQRLVLGLASGSDLDIRIHVLEFPAR